MTRTDTERLEWLVSEGVSVVVRDYGCYLFDYHHCVHGEVTKPDGSYFYDWRELIDYNMELDNES